MANGQWLIANLFLKIDVQQLFCRNKRTQLRIEYPLLDIGYATLDFRVEVEAAFESFVYALVHPILILLVAVVLEVAVCLDMLDILLDTLPNLLQTDAFE